MLNESLHIKVNVAEIASKVMDGEAIMINLANGTYYSSDKVGGFVWELIEQGCLLGEIIRTVVSAYEVDAERVAADIGRWVEELAAENLIVISDTGAPASDAMKPSAEAVDKQAYEGPALQIYRDMADLLALDPPMPGMMDTPWKDDGGTDTEKK